MLLRKCTSVFALFASLAVSGCGAPAGDDSSTSAEELSGNQYSNPIIPMFKLPSEETARVTVDADEGCPDPSAIKEGNEFYIYCTSYEQPRDRTDGFPIYKASSLGGNHWTRVSSKDFIIPNTGSQSSWPNWIRDENGRRFGNFWAPDVRKLPNGKFVATYGAPCGSTQCVGQSWGPSPTGPWTHGSGPLISKSHNGAGFDMNYDPNVLVWDAAHIYLLWKIAGHGVHMVQVAAKPTGQLEIVGPSQKIYSPPGEGPYAIKHNGKLYLFTSMNPILYNYEVHVVRGTLTPGGPGSFQLALEPGERTVIQPSPEADGDPVNSTAFVATGGNSVIQDAVNGEDFLFYHAIKVPKGNACPGVDPATGQNDVHRDATTNPYCRLQQERQAMMDPIKWDASDWPTVKGGVPSTGRQTLP